MRGSTKPAGFTLVELVVVVLILGILAAVAAPRMIGTTSTATENSMRQTLAVVRDAIETYAAVHGVLPGADGQQATFKANVAEYLRGGVIPKCTVDGARSDEVQMRAAGDDLPGQGGTVGTHSWVYSYDTGDFRINCPDLSDDGVTKYVDF